MSNREYESLEKIQKQALYNIFNISQSAPYIAFLSEIGILPAKKQILIKKINLYHTLKTSDDKRVAKKVLEQQEASEKEGSWYVELKNEVMKYDMAEVLEIGKTKKEVKKKVNETFKKQIEMDLSKAGTKSRFVKQFGEKRYLAELGKSDTKTYIDIRLNMTKLKMNFKSSEYDLKCRGCQMENETTEHVVKCRSIKTMISWPDEKILEENCFLNTDDIDKVRATIEYFKTMLEHFI